MKKRVVIDPGHGGSAPGAVYRGLLEKDVVLNVALIVAEGLRFYDYDVMMTREVDESVSLQRRCDIANRYNAHVFISIHLNADPDEDLPGMPEAKGEEIWIHKGSIRGRGLAEALKDEIDLIFPLEPFRGIKESDKLYVLKHTRMPAVLIELGFIDKSSSLETFSELDTIEDIAMLIVEGIEDYFVR